MVEIDSKEIFYVSINNSKDLRKNILETSKSLIENLHSFEKFRTIRAEKIKAMEELIVLFKEINDISSQVKIEMPKIKLPTLRKFKKEEKKKEVEKKVKHESDDELAKLESAIQQIESRLSEIK